MTLPLSSGFPRDPAPERAAPAASLAPPVLAVRPVRAAFGPHVSLVSVDVEGRLWVRLSTAVAMMVSGLLLVLVPLSALWFAGGGLVRSGQVDFTPTGLPGQHSQTEAPAPVAPTELPLAHQRDRATNR